MTAEPCNEDIMEFQLIKCPRQPGNLRISKNACALRYLEAQKIRAEIPVREFDIIRKIGLETCKTCPLGKRNTLELQISNHKTVQAQTKRSVQKGNI